MAQRDQLIIANDMATLYGILDFNANAAERLAKQLQNMTAAQTELPSSDLLRALTTNFVAAYHPENFAPNPGDQNFFRNEHLILFLEGDILNRTSIAKTLAIKPKEMSHYSLPKLIAHGFSRRGPEFFNELDGSFRLILWDALNNVLYLATDRFGFRPLYFHARENRLIFASTVKHILAALEKTPAVDSQAVVDFVAFGQLLDERTFFEDIALIPAGSYLRANRDHATICRYAADPPSAGFIHNEQEATTLLRNAIMVALKNYSEREPNGCLLDGPDSYALIAGLQRLGKPPVLFKIHEQQNGATTARDTTGIDESNVAVGAESFPVADLFAQRMTAHLHSADLTPQRFVENFARTIWLGDGLINGLHAQRLILLSVLREYPCLLLDDLQPLDTSCSLRELPLFHTMRRNPAGINALAANLFDKIYLSGDWQTFISKPSILKAAVGLDVIDPGLRVRCLFASAAERHDSPLLQISDLNLRVRQRRHAAMVTNLLRPFVRVGMPYYSFSYFSLCQQIPEKWRTVEKTLLRKILDQLQPDLMGASSQSLNASRGIRNWKKNLRRGFELLKSGNRQRNVHIHIDTAFDFWLKKNPYVQRRVQRWLLDWLVQDYFTPKEVRRLLYQHLTGRANHLDMLGRIMTINLWHRQFVEEIKSFPPPDKRQPQDLAHVAQLESPQFV